MREIMNTHVSKKPIFLFDFSSSPVGGGLKRLLEYMVLMPKILPEKDVWFIVHRMANIPLGILNSSQVIRSETPRWKRLFFEGSDAWKFYKAKGPIEYYFGYGIPIQKKIGRINWVHISNALTLKTNGFTLKPKRRIEMSMLGYRFDKAKRIAEIMSAESDFALGLLASRQSKSFPEYVLLPNGVDIKLDENIGELNMENFPEIPYFLTVGTASYKRIETAYSVAEHLSNMLGAPSWKLICIGADDEVTLNQRQREHVVFLNHVPHSDLKQLLKKCLAYISASEVENSSNAALESVVMAPMTILSDIPAHRELFKEDDRGCKTFQVNGIGFFSIKKRNIDELKINKSWYEVATDMMDYLYKFKMRDL